MNVNSLTANRIKEKREDLKIKQSVFAKQIGMSPTAYSRLENGETQITINTLVLISDALKTTISDLVQLKETAVYNFSRNNIVQQGSSHTLNLNLTPDQFLAFESIIRQQQS